MKLYKGTFCFYAATGELPHFYVWLGEPNENKADWGKHIIIEQNDIVIMFGCGQERA